MYTSGSLGWVSINLNGIELARKEVWVGYSDAQISGPDYVNSYGRYSAVYNPVANPYFYWYVDVAWPNDYSMYDYGSYIDVYFYNNATYSVNMYACNNCGCCDEEHQDVYAYPGRSLGSFSFYPNPVNDILFINIDQQAILAKYAAAGRSAIVPTCEIRLYNIMGVQVYQTATNGAKVQINVSNLHSGIYFIHLYDGISAAPEVKSIVIKH